MGAWEYAWRMFLIAFVAGIGAVSMLYVLGDDMQEFQKLNEKEKTIRRMDAALHIAAKQIHENYRSCETCPLSSAFPAVNDGITCGGGWSCEDALVKHWKGEAGIPGHSA